MTIAISRHAPSTDYFWPKDIDRILAPNGAVSRRGASCSARRAARSASRLQPAAWGVGLVVLLDPEVVPRADAIRIDWLTVAYTFGLSLPTKRC